MKPILVSIVLIIGMSGCSLASVKPDLKTLERACVRGKIGGYDFTNDSVELNVRCK